MAWAAIAAAAISAGAGLYSSNRAANASGSGAKKAIEEQRRQYDNAMQMLEPNRYVGYQALSDLASLYGYGTSGYTPYNAMNYGSGGVYGVKGNVGGGGGGSMSPTNPMYALPGQSLSPLGSADKYEPVGKYLNGLFGSDGPKTVGGTIDANAGYVDAAGGSSSRDDVFTNYLRTGEWSGDPKDKGKKKYAALISAIDRLRGSGWTYGESGGQFPGSVAPTQPGQPGNMSRFFASPDYNFRRTEGIRGIEQGAAARGGALSGNALRGVANYSSNLAAGEFGQYINRLLSMAGMGQVATNNAITTGQNTANQVGNYQQQYGDARASGILSGYNAAANSINTGWQNYLMGQWLNQQRKA